MNRLQDELSLADFSTWIRPLQGEVVGDHLTLFAPNRFVKEWFDQKYAARVLELWREMRGQDAAVSVRIGSAR
ncbi:MAG: chromosomal replication initiator protein DnaA, partial [Gammaproteobacteria bacterium]